MKFLDTISRIDNNVFCNKNTWVDAFMIDVLYDRRESALVNTFIVEILCCLSTRFVMEMCVLLRQRYFIVRTNVENCLPDITTVNR